MIPPPPSVLQIELTKNCNNACLMCHKGQCAPDKDFDRSDISDVALKQVKPVFPFLKHAMLFGDGEPMMFKGFWNVVQDIGIAAPQCSIDFINNGSLMNQTNVEKCLEYQVSSMGLSLGGATPETHNKIRKLSDLNRIIKNFTYLKQRKEQENTKEPYLSILIVVMKSNLHELPDFIKLADQLGAVTVLFQKMFVIHAITIPETVEDNEAKPLFQKSAEIAEFLGIGLSHYLGDVKQVRTSKTKINLNDRFCQPHYDHNLQPNGYCAAQQPWNTVYVLHSGIVVPDCHWWASTEKPQYDNCGTLDENTSIFDIWNGITYQKIRKYIQEGIILPQCRGCGLAGGIKPQFRSERTDHTVPNTLIQLKPQKKTTLHQIADQSKTKEQEDIFRQICENILDHKPKTTYNRR